MAMPSTAAGISLPALRCRSHQRRESINMNALAFRPSVRYRNGFRYQRIEDRPPKRSSIRPVRMKSKLRRRTAGPEPMINMPQHHACSALRRTFSAPVSILRRLQSTSRSTKLFPFTNTAGTPITLRSVLCSGRCRHRA